MHTDNNDHRLATSAPRDRPHYCDVARQTHSILRMPNQCLRFRSDTTLIATGIANPIRELI